VTLVLLRDKTGRDHSKSEIRQAQEPKINDDRRHTETDQPRHAVAVSLGAAFENSVETAKEPAEPALDHAPKPIPPRATGLQENGRERGAECERIKRRDERRNRNGQRELPVELPGDAADKGRWNKYRGQH